ncbi:MAG TPA: transposase [Burkholderiales bacterium]|nr:transposase [Burkholderiales bacterium]
MARKPRLHVPGGLYHVVVRGNARQNVFFIPQDRHYFYDLLAEGIVRFGYRVHAFCLMTNHLHLALQVGQRELSAGMQNLSFRYTRYLNARLNRVGHVFQGRFKAFLVDQDSYGLALVRYIHLNPVRARMVREPAAYPWSSHRAYLGMEDLPWLTSDWVLGQFDERRAPARTKFAAFVDSGRHDGHSDLFYGGEADSRVVGAEDFLKQVVPEQELGFGTASLADIVAYVCRCSGFTEQSLLELGRNRRAAQLRALIAWLATRSRSCSLAEVAAHFSRSPSTLSRLVANLEKLSHNDGETADALRKHLYAIMQA